MNADTPLPTRLGKSPLIEALFEIRFKAVMPVSSILTGVLYTRLGCTEIQRSPQSDIPEQFRQMDPNLMYAPLTRLVWGEFHINIGDRNILISNSLPYSGWNSFQSKIQQILEIAAEVNLITSVERFSLKYLDIFSMPGFSPEGDGFKFKIDFPSLYLKTLATHARVEIPDGVRQHIVQYFGDAVANLPSGSTRQGVMVDVDTIEVLHDKPFSEFMSNFTELSDSLHLSNKNTFFTLLSESGLKALEPQYD